MDIQQIVTLLQGRLSGGTLTVPATLLQSQPIATLFTAYLPNGQLVLTGVSGIVDGGTYAEAVGTGGAGGPFAGLVATARFTVLSGVAQVDLTATTGASWDWSRSFAILGQTLLATLPFAPGSTLTFSSAVAAQPGLSFSGSLPLDGLFTSLKWLLGNGTAVTLSGPVPINQGIPLPLLSVTAGDAVNLTLVELPWIRFSAGAELIPATAQTAARPQGFLELATELDFEANHTSLKIPLTARFNTQTTMVVLSVNLTDLNKEIDALLADLDALFGGTDYFSQSLKTVPLSSILALKGVILQLDLAAARLNSVRVMIGSTQSWTIVSERRTRFGAAASLVTLDDVSLVLGLFDPFGAKQVGVAIFATVSIGATGKLVASAEYPGFAFDLELAPGTQIDLTQVVEHFLGENPDIPALVVDEFDLHADPTNQTYEGGIRIETAWPISLGATTLTLEQLQVMLDRTGGKTTGRLHGEVEIAGANVNATWDIGGPLQIAGTLPPLDLGKLIAALSADHLRPDFVSLTLQNSSLYLERRADGGYYLAVGTTVAGFGAFEIEFLEVAGKTGWAFGFVLEDHWSLSTLDPAFAPLSFIQLSQAGLLYATMDDPNFAFRSFTDPNFKFPSRLPNAPPGVVAGLSLYAALDLAGGPLDVIARVLPGVGTLVLSAELPGDYSKTQFRAACDQPLPLIPGVLVLDDIAVAFAPGQAQFGLDLDATFTIHGSSFKLGGNLLVASGAVTLELHTETPWQQPFGIQGLVLDEMGLAIAVGDELVFTLGGKVTIGQGASQVTLEAAAEFNVEEEGLPDVFEARETGTITLAEIVNTFTQSRLPAALSTIALSDFQLLVVANPLGWNNPLDNKHYQPGLAFSGDLHFFNLDARFAVQVDYARGVFASGQIDKPLTIGPLTLANATNPAAGPFIQIDTANSPYFRMSAALTVFEIASLTVAAEVDSGGLSYAFDFTIAGLGEVAYTLALKDKTSFTLSAKASFAIARLGPLKVGALNLGSLTIDLSLDAHFSLVASPSSLSITLGGQFTFEGKSLTLHDLTVTVNITRFAQLAQVFAETLAEQLWTIAKDVLHDVQALFRLIGSGVITITDDFGKILKTELNVTLADAAKLLRSVSAAIGYDAHKVASLLASGFSALDHEVAAAMRGAAYAVEDVAAAVATVFGRDARAMAAVLQTAGYDLNAVATALKHVWSYDAHAVATLFHDVFRTADTAVHAALQAAGYVAADIASAMKSVFDWVDHVVDKVKNALNPKNW